MKLSQMFTGQTQAGGEVLHREEIHAQQPVRNTASINRQIRSLVPGQTVSGEIVGKNGSEVQIRLADDTVMNARVDRNLNIEIGKNMTFEVKSNGSALTLSPLFTNVSTDVNVLKALDMAGLPVNQASVEMTEKLMEAGLPVNRNTLLQVYREINSFPQTQIADVVDLHRLQMPVNEANLNQIGAYRSLTHQLLQGMEAVTDALPEVFAAMQESGDSAGAVKLYQELFMLLQEGSGEGQELSDALASLPEGAGQEALQGEAGVLQDGAAQAGQEITAGQENAAGPGNPALAGSDALGGQSLGSPEAPAVEDGMQQVEGAEISESLRAAVSEEVLSMVKNLPLTEGQMAEAVRQAEQFAAGETDASQFLRAMARLVENVENPQNGMPQNGAAFGSPDAVQDMGASGNPNVLQGMDASGNSGVPQGRGALENQDAFRNGGLLQNSGMTDRGAMLVTEDRDKAMGILAKMFSKPAFQKLLNGQLKKMWTVSPREVAEPGKIEELYRRLDRQLKSLSNALEHAGQADSAASRAASNLSQNVDFLQQINQMYAYVQLPLRLQQGEAHGDLYVYTNKKHLARGDGKVSALLHLDMENLGPVDIYVTLQNNKVSTSFRVRDDEMLEFLSRHMDLLTERLKKRGYDCSYSMTTKGELDSGAAESGIAPILQQEKGIALAQYAFDVRT